MTNLFTKLASAMTALALVLSSFGFGASASFAQDAVEPAEQSVEQTTENQEPGDAGDQTDDQGGAGDAGAATGEDGDQNDAPQGAGDAPSGEPENESQEQFTLFALPTFSGANSLDFDALDAGEEYRVEENATFAAYEALALSVADRLVALQRADGSWGWDVSGASGPASTGYYNVTGVTAWALLDAYSITRIEAYLDAAEAAGDYIASQSSSFGSARQNGYNAVYLYNLSEVSGNTAHADVAADILEAVFTSENYWSSCGADGCSAEELAAAILQYRAGNVNIAAWDIAAYVEALVNADEHELATDVYAELSELNPSEAIGLAAELRAAVAVSSSDASGIVVELVALQNGDGSFASIQDTAYALMALVESSEVTEAAATAAAYLSTSAEATDDRWIESDGREYAEVNSEAAHALAGYFYEANTRYSIQDAIDSVAESGIVSVAAGTYNENAVINKSITLEGSADGTAIITGQVNVRASDVVVDGLTITNPTYSGPSVKGIQIWNGNGTTLTNVTLQNNTITNINNAENGKGATGIQVQGNVSDITVLNNVINNLTASATGGWVHAIEVTPSSGVTNVPQNVIIEGNTVSDIVPDSHGAQSGFSVDSSGSVFADASQVTFIKNSLIGVNVRNLDDVALDVSGNYWGSESGPAAGQVTGVTTVSNWYVDEAMTRLNTDPEPRRRGGSSGGSVRSTSTNAAGEVAGAATSPAGEVLGASTYAFSSDLTIGSTGAEVTALQAMLIASGHLTISAPTGYFGEMTRAALAEWQAANGVSPASGYFGPLTRAAVAALGTPAPVMSDEARAALIADLLEQVAAIQARIAEMMEESEA